MSQATSITVHVPLNIQRRGGRKVVIAPDGSVLPPVRPSLVPPTADPVLVKALARAFRWKRMLDEGRYASVRELADGEGVKPSYAAGMLRLTLLAPDIVEAILDGRQTDGASLARLTTPLPACWVRQRRLLLTSLWQESSLPNHYPTAGFPQQPSPSFRRS